MILFTVCSCQFFLVGWFHRIIFSLVSWAWHRQDPSVSWYEKDFTIIAVGRMSLQHLVVRKSLWILLMEMERHFQVMISMVESFPPDLDWIFAMYRGSMYALCNWYLYWLVIAISLIYSVAGAKGSNVTFGKYFPWLFETILQFYLLRYWAGQEMGDHWNLSRRPGVLWPNYKRLGFSLLGWLNKSGLSHHIWLWGLCLGMTHCIPCVWFLD